MSFLIFEKASHKCLSSVFLFDDLELTQRKLSPGKKLSRYDICLIFQCWISATKQFYV